MKTLSPISAVLAHIRSYYLQILKPKQVWKQLNQEVWKYESVKVGRCE